MRSILICISCIFSFSLFGIADNNFIVVRTQRYLLEVYTSKGELIHTFQVGIGLNGIYKTEEGDKKTPIGEYHILCMASVYFKEDGGDQIGLDKGFILQNRYFENKQEDSEALFSDAYGKDGACFMCLDFPNEQDRERGLVAVGIYLHKSI